MGASTKSAADAAGEILRCYLKRDRNDGFPAHWMWEPRTLGFEDGTPWYQLPQLRRSRAPWFVPIGRFDQAVFAEAFRQALAEGLEVPHALGLATSVTPCACLRRALQITHAWLRAGYPLGLGLKRSRAWVGSALPGALEVGEEFGCLEAALAAFVRQARGFTGPRYRRAIGRRPATTHYAAALAALVGDHPLSPKVIRAAVRMAGGSRRFVAAIHAIGDAVNDGIPFVTALEFHPRHFDPLFRAFLERTESREEMRACLERLACAGDLL